MSDTVRRGAVLDASAIIALLREEPGADLIEERLADARVSTVNVSEILQKAAQRGLWEPGFDSDLEALGVRIDPFTATDARIAAAIWEAAPNSGLSLGDRACLALAFRLDLPAYTTDTAWSKLDLGMEIVNARG